MLPGSSACEPIAMAEFIVYVCPTGELAEQIQRFFEESLVQHGANTAHAYMPHCTLTGFFEDRFAAVPLYTQRLTRSYKRAYPSRTDPIITVEGLTFKADWHGLELQSPWLKHLMVDFACTAVSPTRKSALRPKNWLHLSLAYGFPSEQSDALSKLATSLVDPQAAVAWELCFYERRSPKDWCCHCRLPLY